MGVKVLVLGAGIAGIIAHNYFKDRGYSVEVYEKESTALNHKGVLRFKDPAVGNLLGCTLKKVGVKKAYVSCGLLYDIPTIRMLNEYSIKTNGRLLERSIYNYSDTPWRWIIEYDKRDISKNCNIKFNHEFLGLSSLDNETFAVFKDLSLDKEVVSSYDLIINTIPLMVLSKCLDYDIFAGGYCEFKEIHVCEFDIGLVSDVNQTIYFSDINCPIYRMTIERGVIIVESIAAADTYFVSIFIEKYFGIPREYINERCSVFKKLGKILPVDDIERRRAILYFTENYNIFSFGRYGVWKPNLKSDDLVSDLNKIERLIKLDSKERFYESRIN